GHGIQRRANLAEHLEAGGGLPRGRRTAERTVHPPGCESRALGVEGHEVQRGSGPGAVSEEAAEEFVASSAGAEVARGGGTADRVVDLVGDAEVVEGTAGRVLVIDVTGSPVRQRPADAAVENVVRADVVGALGEGPDGPEVSFAGGPRRPVDLVEAETGPD